MSVLLPKCETKEGDHDNGGGWGVGGHTRPKPSAGYEARGSLSYFLFRTVPELSAARGRSTVVFFFSRRHSETGVQLGTHGEAPFMHGRNERTEKGKRGHDELLFEYANRQIR